jgi:hypothetical protein
MKFLKTKNISKWSTSDRTLIVYPKGNGPGNRVVMNATGGLMLPKGTVSERPQPVNPNPLVSISSVRQPTDSNGTIRYNTSTNPATGRVYGIEAFVDGAWEIVRAPGDATIVKQTLGPANGADVDFFFTVGHPPVVSADNLIVLVENVMQISVTNFNLLGGFDGIRFTSPVPVGKFVTVYFGFAN